MRAPLRPIVDLGITRGDAAAALSRLPDPSKTDCPIQPKTPAHTFDVLVENLAIERESVQARILAFGIGKGFSTGPDRIGRFATAIRSASLDQAKADRLVVGVLGRLASCGLAPGRVEFPGVDGSRYRDRIILINASQVDNIDGEFEHCLIRKDLEGVAACCSDLLDFAESLVPRCATILTIAQASTSARTMAMALKDHRPDLAAGALALADRLDHIEDEAQAGRAASAGDAR